MNVLKHISNDIKAPLLTDSVGEVLGLMEEMKVAHLPVIDGDSKLLGVIDEDSLLEIEDPKVTIESCIMYFGQYSVRVDAPIFEVIRIGSEASLSLVPIVDKNSSYKGYISLLDLLQDLGNQISIKEEGGLLVLQIPIIDYQLTQIAQIVESEDARILGCWMNASEVLESVDVTIKINQKDLGRIIKSFERYSYTILEVYHDSLFDDTSTQRYESLMRYLNI